MHRRRSLLLLLALSGCTEGAERAPDAETEHLRFFYEEHFPSFCQADLEQMESVYAEIGHVTGIDLNGSMIDVHFWPFDPDTGGIHQDSPCRWTATGCYDQYNDAVHATLISWDHELAHAAIDQEAGNLPDYLDEAFAEAFTEFETIFPLHPRLPAEQILVRDRRHVSRETGAHFVQWAIHEYGMPDFRGLNHLDGKTAIEEWTGASVEEAQAQWLATSAFAYPSVHGCDEYPSFDVSSGEFRIEAPATCGEGARNWGGDALGNCYMLEGVQPGVYRLEVSEHGRISRCLVEPRLDAGFHMAGLDPLLDDVPPRSRYLSGVEYVELNDTDRYKLCVSGAQPASLEGRWVASEFSWP